MLSRVLRRRLALCRESSDGGFTLTEMLTALMIISLALFALLSCFVVAERSIQSQQTRSKAARVALDRNEALRLAGYDSTAMSLGTHTGTTTGPDGLVYNYSYVVSTLEAVPGGTDPGNTVKQVATTVSWGGNHPGSITYTTAIAQDASDVGLPAGYIQSIKSISVVPDPSVVVDYDGHTAEPITVTVAMTGFDVSDVVHIAYTDDAGAHTANATSTNGRYWTLTIPAGATGIYKNLSSGQQYNMVFTASTDTGLTTSATLRVFGPTLNPPTVNSFAVTGDKASHIALYKGGKNQFLNKTDVTFSCVVNGLTSTSDSVKAKYPRLNADSSITYVEVQLSTTNQVNGGQNSTWTGTVPKDIETFNFNNASNQLQQFVCSVRRLSDGGRASSTTNVAVRTNGT